MLIKINRKECLNKYPIFPFRTYDYIKEEEVYFYPKVFNSCILTLPSKSFKGHTKLLGTELNKLAKELGGDTLIFLGDTELPWLYQVNDYKPAKEAQQYLIDNKIGKRFNGALQISSSELPTFIKHLCWLTRCNAALPYIHFIDTGQNIIGNICQYGNLHLDTLNAKIDKHFKIIIDKSMFMYLEGNKCYNQFGKTSAINGRQTVS